MRNWYVRIVNLSIKSDESIFLKNSEFATSAPPLRAERKTPFPFCLQDLIMAHLNIPQPEKMAEREADLG